jgi:rRNA maturation endonuclease Nob1
MTEDHHGPVNRYENGYQYCSTCAKWYPPPPTLRCPVCSHKLRCSSRATRWRRNQ